MKGSIVSGVVLLATLACASAVVISNGNNPPVHIRTTDNGTFYLPLRSPDPRVARTEHNMSPEQIKITYWAPGQMLISWSTGEHRMHDARTAALQTCCIQMPRSLNWSYVHFLSV